MYVNQAGATVRQHVDINQSKRASENGVRSNEKGLS